MGENRASCMNRVCWFHSGYDVGRRQAAEDALHASTQETLENIRLVKASVSEERAIDNMDDDRVVIVTHRRAALSISKPSGAYFFLAFFTLDKRFTFD